MFGNVASLSTQASGQAADRALDILRQAAIAVLRQFGAPEGLSKDLAFQIWGASHGVAMLALSGHLDAAKGCDPATILDQTIGSIIEMAIRRGLNEKPVTR